uniref:Uncharacterized protein n=1 Tax=Acrobeloides nanus TaxID=290746 RepID=A0A914CHH7_9BILA
MIRANAYNCMNAFLTCSCDPSCEITNIIGLANFSLIILPNATSVNGIYLCAIMVSHNFLVILIPLVHLETTIRSLNAYVVSDICLIKQMFVHLEVLQQKIR